MNKYGLGFLLLLISTVSHSLPFNIVPFGALPTTVSQGSTVSAQYTVTNNTSSVRNNNFVKYLPANVTQVTTGSGVCGATFNLAPKGSSGDSCILSLSVSGAVNGNDPTPSNNLFVCFPGGTTCAGTEYRLNVTQLASYNGPFSVIPGVGPSFPVLVTSIDGAVNWENRTIPSVTNQSGQLNAVSCYSDNTNCVAVGATTVNFGNSPLIMVSNDGGAVWTSSTLTGVASTVVFDEIACATDGSFCLAVGPTLSLAASPPTVAQSYDGGKTWNNITISGLTTTSGDITGVTCTSDGEVCLIFGEVANMPPSPATPILFQTLNGGIDWSSVSISGVTTVNAASCEGTVSDYLCVAIGNESSGTGYYTQSTVSNPDWAAPIISTPDINMNGVQCSNNASSSITCVIAGDDTSANAPFLAVTQDAGGSWATPSIGGSSVATSGLNSASCVEDENFCIAVGSFDTDELLVAQSTDGGSTWTNTQPFTLLGELGYSGCTTTGICMATGSLDSGQPLLVGTFNTGTSWKQISIPGVTNQQGQFFAGSYF